ncbi:MAG: tRNA (guanosine(37)-N1)-methyltransferase TrmD [Eubacteriaceae bacterium]|jgi:tRNA (guanine37-N1)-methyltransferase|nr:tRNA (guanosine(37)-N1)-methyltransferase TrmD [Eubacteriaceae bacterium]
MKFYFLTLFPEMIHAYFKESLMEKGLKEGIIDYEVLNIRDFSQDKHKRVDDYPFGGGAGMVMTPQPIIDALKSIPEREKYPVIYLSSGGSTYKQKTSSDLSAYPGLILICGRYEGIDQRIIDAYVDYELSVGDYILTGGELAALIICDSVCRHLKGYLGNPESLEDESFNENLLEYPQYTRPREFEGMQVPEILLSGNHGQIKEWRLKQSIEKTVQIRPDLYKKYLSKNKH